MLIELRDFVKVSVIMACWGEDRMEERDIYTCVNLVHPVINDDNIPTFAISKYHVTYHYQPDECWFPEGINENDWIRIVHKGIYDDGEILASAVHLERSTVNVNQEQRDNLRYQRLRYDEDGNEMPHYPLHITWDSGHLPPVEAGERLLDPELRDMYYNNHNMVNGSYGDYNYKEDTMIAHDLDINSDQARKSYHRKLHHLFSYFHPIGIWKTYRVPIEN